MNELIKVDTNQDRPTVLGRGLHEFLEVGTPYHIWFPRMCEYGFVENVDYQAFEQKCSKPTGGRPSLDHQLTIDMAKEISMLQRTERGKQARQYFISIEKKWNSPEAIMARALQIANRQLEDAKGQLALLETKNQALLEQAEEDRPKVLFAHSVQASKTSVLVREMAKILRQNSIETGERRLYAWLRDNGYLIKKSGSDYNMPTQRSMELGIFEIKESTVNAPDGTVLIARTPKVTGKGQIYFVNKFKQEEAGA